MWILITFHVDHLYWLMEFQNDGHIKFYSPSSIAFRYRASNTLFGALQKDRVSWNGMVGAVQRRSVDVAVGPVTMTAERAKAIDFTFPIQIIR